MSEDIRLKLEKAAKLVESLPPSLQETAFKCAFEQLCQNGQGDAPAKAAPPRKITKAGRKKQSASVPIKARPFKKLGPKAILTEMYDSGYFKTARKSPEVIKEVKDTKGFAYQSDAIGTALLRLVREKKLKRERAKDGKYEYVNR